MSPEEPGVNTATNPASSVNRWPYAVSVRQRENMLGGIMLMLLLTALAGGVLLAFSLVTGMIICLMFAAGMFYFEVIATTGLRHRVRIFSAGFASFFLGYGAIVLIQSL